MNFFKNEWKSKSYNNKVVRLSKEINENQSQQIEIMEVNYNLYWKSDFWLFRQLLVFQVVKISLNAGNLPDLVSVTWKLHDRQNFWRHRLLTSTLMCVNYYHFTEHITDVANGKSGFDTFFHLLVVLVVQGQHLLQVGEQLLQQLLGHDVRIEEGPIEKALKDFEVAHVALLRMEKLCKR